MIGRMVILREQRNKSEQQYYRSYYVIFLAVFNAGFVLLLANFVIGNLIYWYDKPQISGGYEKFTLEWYRLMGSIMCLIIMFQTITQ